MHSTEGHIVGGGLTRRMIDLTGLMDAFVRGVGLVPPPLLAIGLLAGPTLAMFLAQRIYGTPDRRPVGIPIEAEFWLCPSCASLTPIGRGTCYHCGLARGPIVGPAAEPPVHEPVPAGLMGELESGPLDVDEAGNEESHIRASA